MVKLEEIKAGVSLDGVKPGMVTVADKFVLALCAFANDLPGRHQPGVLIGARDDGTLIGRRVSP